MIGYIEGKIVYKRENIILLMVNGIGYEVMIPKIVMKSLDDVFVDDILSLYIYYYQTEKQPKPILIGFKFEEEKDFFRKFTSTNAIGVIKAFKALDLPICKISEAIENGDVDTLKKLNGIGVKTAQKILIFLQGKMGRFNSINNVEMSTDEAVIESVMEVLVAQLGYKVSDANKMIENALKRNKSIGTSEQLFDEIYKDSR